MKDNKFRIIIPAYNCENWIRRCMWSIVNQGYFFDAYSERHQSVFIDDCSTDKTFDIVKEYFENIAQKQRFRFFKRKKNVGALENIVYGISTICFDDEDIIVLIDGDDALYSNDVFEYLNEVYQDPNILLTYGQYVNESNKRLGNNRPLQVPSNEYRLVKSGPMYWCTSHLRTFKYKLWKRIRDEDFRDWNGNYLKMAWDMAIMLPLIEMAGNERIKYIDKIMYLYNDLNPINDFKKDIRLQEYSAKYVRSKLRYRKLRDDEI